MSAVVLVANRSSGGADDDTIRTVRDVLSALGPVEVVVPPSAGSFEPDLQEAAAGCDLVVVAGGDGTMNLAANALAGRLADVALALVPMGTGNDLVRTIALPRDPVEAARAIVDGVLHDLDLGRVRGPGVDRLFVNACMGGFPVEVNQAIDDGLKRKLGPAAFWVGGAKAATELQRTTVVINEVEVRDCVAAGVGNGQTCGGGIRVWPSAAIDDGLLDGCALGASNHAAAVALAAKVKRGSHEELESVVTARAEKITIRSEPDIGINVDGELIGLRTPATFERVGAFRMRF
jgi:diacylglycerol kinase (ATP)